MIVRYKEYNSTRKQAKNLKKSDDLLFKDANTVTVKASHIVYVKNATIFLDLIVSNNSFKKYQPYCQINKISLKKKMLKNLFFLKKSNTISKGVWCIDNWSYGYFHWFTDVLPRLIVANEVDDSYPILLPNSLRKFSFVEESLAIINQKAIFYDSTINNKVEDLMVTSHTAHTGNYNKHIIEKVRDLFTTNLDHSKKPDRHIFISREKAPRRKIINEIEVQEVLLKNDIEIHYFEDYSLEKQIQIMHEAKTLIGLHGAGLTNMLFMRKGGNVLEFRNHTDSKNNCYFSLASELDINYYYQLTKGNSENTYDTNVFIDLKQLQEVLNLIN
ncbi:glycosyltransferase family 61 protein [Flammeovirga kamogawensis]|uniref:Glycosyltransferase family 61 protein n=1 Tax=Flammeovirga kamogawensis TaxID=373891 RepID=A0ABX8GXD6_9BACT|nr:glycosyltransferase family 61 protein [Flammeovirga kamogawensis]MBB6461215.1 capsular polysaccharide biosynthesis protein [Flammeovirga kamogawensis]QWG07777.1 glycosyltransferase family 61 protein [Flammeovirga kamogawensis]TRX69583.1 glycosyltransferase family 61 protein [Flammeovirga kamogawensis]